MWKLHWVSAMSRGDRCQLIVLVQGAGKVDENLDRSAAAAPVLPPAGAKPMLPPRKGKGKK